MTSGNLRKLHIVYWRHPVDDWENARTTELLRELTYDDNLRLPMRQDLDYVTANCHRRTESYARYHDIVERLRSKKVRREPLVYMELWQDGLDKRKEEYWSIDSDYRLKEVLKRILTYINWP